LEYSGRAYYIQPEPDENIRCSGRLPLRVPDRIVVAFFPKLDLYGFCPVEGRFAELLKILESEGAMGLER
jgi:hypothetical protein